MLLIPNNTDSKVFGEHAALRQVAARREMGIVYLRNFDTGIEHRKEAPAEPDRTQKVLHLVADATGIVEFRHAPSERPDPQGHRCARGGEEEDVLGSRPRAGRGVARPPCPIRPDHGAEVKL